MKLYELSQAQETYRAELEYRIAQMTDAETGEFTATEEDMARLAELSEAATLAEVDLDDKAETIALFTLDLDAEAKAIKEQEQKLAKRRKTLENKSEWLKAYLASNITGRKIRTPRVTIGWRKSTAVETDDDFLVWAMSNDDQYLRFKSPEVDKTALKEALKAGVEVPHAALVERETMTIK